MPPSQRPPHSSSDSAPGLRGGGGGSSYPASIKPCVDVSPAGLDPFRPRARTSSERHGATLPHAITSQAPPSPSSLLICYTGGVAEMPAQGAPFPCLHVYCLGIG